MLKNSNITVPFHLPTVAGLHFWRSVFLSGGKTGCFVLQELERRSKPAESNSKHIRVLVFLVLNCLTKVPCVQTSGRSYAQKPDASVCLVY